MRIYLAVVEAVYDHGVVFASASREAVERFTEEFAPDRDGYHKWRIDEIELDTVTPPGDHPIWPVRRSEL